MKECFKCHVVKSLDEFYKHPEMKDGHLNKCKVCTRLDISNNVARKSEDPMWSAREAERQRIKERNRYYILKSDDVYKKRMNVAKKNWKLRNPEKNSARISCQRLPRDKNQVLHHWSYDKIHWKDIIPLNKVLHRLLHRFLIYVPEKRLYRSSEGILLDTKEKHLTFLHSVVTF